MDNFKNIHIGTLINHRITESGIEMSRICKLLNYTPNEVAQIFQQEHIESGVLLKLSKLLQYDFFRIYSQHLILYAPIAAENQTSLSSLPNFRKNIYTKELIDFILELVKTEQKTKQQIIEEYKIPKTTLYKWISKYKT